LQDDFFILFKLYMNKPSVLISACLNQQKVRYNGLNVYSPNVEKMRSFVNFISICPELEIGLGVPREESKLWKKDNQFYFIYTKDYKDYTIEIENVYEKIKNKMFFGIILKSKSPSCGLGNAKYYHDLDFKIPMGKTNGIFANKIIEKYPYLPVIDDGRLNDEILNYEFWTKVFCYYNFSNVKDISELISFHTDYKFLFFSFSIKWAKELGNIIANHKKDFEKTYTDYKNLFIKFSQLRFKITLDINIIFHLFGYFSKYLNPKEKQYFLNLIERYRYKQISRNTLIELFKINALRFNNTYLLQQKYFNPFPQ